MKRIGLITRADDAGSARSANFAIRDCCQNGILRNASVIACAEELEHAYEVLGSLEGICIGLHAAICCEWAAPHRWKPVSNPEKLKTLVDRDGYFYPIVHERANDISPNEVMIEIKAQLEKLRSIGFKVSYLDTHMGFDWIDGLRERILDFCDKEKLINGFHAYKKLPEIDNKTGSYSQIICRQIEAAPNGIYLLVAHPCYDNEEMRRFIFAQSGSSPVPDREYQRQIFVNDEIMRYYHQGIIVPLRYDQLSDELQA